MIDKLKKNKALRICLRTVKAIVTLFIVVVISIIFVQRISNNKLNLGGFGMYTIISESMVPKYQIGDMVITRNTTYDDLEIGDDVVYMGKKSDFAGKIVTHQVIGKDVKEGIRYLQTKGLANDTEDPSITEDQILGKVILKGRLLSFVSHIVNNSYGFYFVIFVPFAILVVMEGIDIMEERREIKEEKNRG